MIIVLSSQNISIFSHPLLFISLFQLIKILNFLLFINEKGKKSLVV